MPFEYKQVVMLRRNRGEGVDFGNNMNERVSLITLMSVTNGKDVIKRGRAGCMVSSWQGAII